MISKGTLSPGVIKERPVDFIRPNRQSFGCANGGVCICQVCKERSPPRVTVDYVCHPLSLSGPLHPGPKQLTSLAGHELPEGGAITFLQANVVWWGVLDPRMMASVYGMGEGLITGNLATVSSALPGATPGSLLTQV